MFNTWNSYVTVEKRPDGDLRAYPVRLETLGFPNIFKDTKSSSLVKFHEEIGRCLESLTPDQRATAFITHDTDDGETYFLFGYFKTETEEERASRIADEFKRHEDAKAYRLKSRRELYETLKAEFGD